MATVYLGLGTNLGDRLAKLHEAVEALTRLGQVVAVSSIYETEPWGDPDQPMFLNLCCALETHLLPEALHGQTKALERQLGRQPGRHWGPRVIDIDLLTYDDVRIETPDLIIPHPRIADRAFVLAPLAEIAPDLHIAGLDKRVAALLETIPNHADVAWIVAPPGAVFSAARTQSQ